MKTVNLFPSAIIKTFLFLFLPGLGTVTVAGPPWVKLNTGYNYIMTGVDFPDNQNSIGFMVGMSLTYQGNGIVLKTTDGGTSWNPVWTGANCGIEGACFTDVNTGYIAGWPKFSNGWAGFGKTMDGGATWTSITVAADLYYFQDVVFKDALNGIVIGSTNSNPVVYATNNGGATWTSASGVSNGVPYGACYVSGNTYFLVDNGGRIKKSTDNGFTWSTVFTLPGALLTGIDFFSDDIGMACGDNGLILKTADGGLTWSVQQVGSDIWRDFGWENQDHVFVCGTPEIIAESIDGGNTWFNGFPQSSYQAALYECIFTENGTGFICGSQGTYLKRLPSCTALFTASATGICSGDQISFSSQSIGDIASYEWYFEGGTPQTSQAPNPVVTYLNTGTFDVQLIVNNGYWSDTLLKADYIQVSVVPAPVVTAIGNQLNSDVPTGNQWYFEGNPIPGANGQSHTATQSGWYWDVVTQNGCKSDTSNNIYIVMTSSVDYREPECTITTTGMAGRFSVSCPSLNMTGYEVVVYNMVGEIIRKQRNNECDKCSTFVDLQSAGAGMYIIVARNGNVTISRRVIITE